MMLTMGIATIAKAIVAGLGTFAAAITVATGDGHVTSVEWVQALVAGLIIAFGTWEVPNATALPTWTTVRDVQSAMQQSAFAPTTAPTTSTVRGTVPTDEA